MKAITREFSISSHNPNLHVSLFSRNEMHYLQYAYWTRSRYDSSLLRNHFDRVNMDLLFNFKIFPLPKETRQKQISHFSIWSLACDFSVVRKMDNKPLSFYESEKYTVSKHEYNQCLKFLPTFHQTPYLRLSQRVLYSRRCKCTKCERYIKLYYGERGRIWFSKTHTRKNTGFVVVRRYENEFLDYKTLIQMGLL